jgi:hypothetical protein
MVPKTGLPALVASQLVHKNSIRLNILSTLSGLTKNSVILSYSPFSSRKLDTINLGQ